MKTFKIIFRDEFDANSLDEAKQMVLRDLVSGASELDGCLLCDTCFNDCEYKMHDIDGTSLVQMLTCLNCGKTFND